jgi:quinolinate synthase
MGEDVVASIQKLRKARKAVILAHNYQPEVIQDIADYVGDSFGLSRQAAATDAEVIVFCGVHFMAECASILSPEKIVLLPDRQAGCPLADCVTAEALREKKEEHPRAKVVCYVNSTAAVKAESDICCTSANALQVVASLREAEVLFVPDRNLGHYVASQLGKELLLWEGCCVTHQRVTVADVSRARAAYPDAPVFVHPECPPEVVAVADYVSSTSGILAYARQTRATRIIIGTEMGILHQLKQQNPDKEFFLLSDGLICPNMKLTTLAKVAQALETLEPRVMVPEDIRERASRSLTRMLAIQ